jgi:hypothetical protein
MVKKFIAKKIVLYTSVCWVDFYKEQETAMRLKCQDFLKCNLSGNSYKRTEKVYTGLLKV